MPHQNFQHRLLDQMSMLLGPPWWESLRCLHLAKLNHQIRPIRSRFQYPYINSIYFLTYYLQPWACPLLIRRRGTWLQQWWRWRRPREATTDGRPRQMLAAVCTRPIKQSASATVPSDMCMLESRYHRRCSHGCFSYSHSQRSSATTHDSAEGGRLEKN